MIVSSHSIELFPEPLHPLEHKPSPTFAAPRAHFRVELVPLSCEPLRELYIAAAPRIRCPREARIAGRGELGWPLAVCLVRLAARIFRPRQARERCERELHGRAEDDPW